MRLDQTTIPFAFCLVRALTLLISLAVFGSLPAEAQQHRSKPPTRAGAQQNLEQLKRRADEARQAGRLEEAIPLYRQAVALRPNWVEGWWYLATLLYERDQYGEAAHAFKRTAMLQPKVGAPWAMLGLCEFRIGDYDNALKHIRQGRQIGLGDNQELSRVVRYHEGALLLLKGDFETAQNIFGALSYDNVSHEDLIIAHGLASLRIPMLPSQVAPDYRDRELIRRAGFAEHLAAQLNIGDAQQEFARLVADYANAPNVQYAYGKYLLKQRDDEGAMAAFQREIENSPQHALARLQIAYIRLRNKEAEAGLKLAEEAVRLHPRLPLGHYILGRIRFEMGDTAKAIEELEIARRLAPNEPRVHFTLARAYDKAGRKTEAAAARETFVRLSKMAEEAAAQGNVRGEAIEEPIEKARPDSPPR